MPQQSRGGHRGKRSAKIEVQKTVRSMGILKDVG